MSKTKQRIWYGPETPRKSESGSNSSGSKTLNRLVLVLTMFIRGRCLFIQLLFCWPTNCSPWKLLCGEFNKFSLELTFLEKFSQCTNIFVVVENYVNLAKVYFINIPSWGGGGDKLGSWNTESGNLHRVCPGVEKGSGVLRWFLNSWINPRKRIWKRWQAGFRVPGWILAEPDVANRTIIESGIKWGKYEQRGENKWGMERKGKENMAMWTNRGTWCHHYKKPIICRYE